MKTLNTLAISVLLATGFGAFAQEPHHHDAHAKTHSESSYKKPVQKFIGDENLKTGMKTVLTTMKSMLQDKSKERTRLQKDTALKIEKTVQEMFKKCKLAADADAAVHPMLADILQGAKLISEAKESLGHEMIHKALLRYDESFKQTGLNLTN